MQNDHYSTLGVSKEATIEEIKKAYKKLAVKYHPDKCKNDKKQLDKFKDISAAYNVLKDPEQKKRYDMGGDSFSGGYHEYENYNHGFNPFGNSRSSGFGGEGDFFSQIFKEFFNQSDSFSQEQIYKKKGADVKIDFKISLNDVFYGSSKDISFEVSVKCSTCNGLHSMSGKKPVKCNYCSGSGFDLIRDGFFTVRKKCSACVGSGLIISDACKKCDNTGRVKGNKTVTVNIPANIQDEECIMLYPGKGEDGILGGPAGDLHIIIIKPNSRT